MRQWLAFKAPIPGWPQQPHSAPVVDTAGQPTQAQNIVAAALVSTAQAGIPKEPVDFPLPPGSDEEGDMDLSHTRKRNRDDDSSDEEQMALKKLPVPLSSPENHDEDKAKSSDLSAQSGGSTACPPTARSLDGASSATTASTSEAHEGAAQTAPTSLPPVESGGAATAEDSSSDTTALLARSTLTATQDLTASDGDDMEEDIEAEDCAAKRKGTKAAPPTAADFLKTAKARAPARKAKKRSKKVKKATRQQQAPATQGATDSPSSQPPYSPPAGAKAANSSKDTTPAAPPPPAEEYFKEVCSKAASRRARKLASAALPVDSAVVGTVLFKPSGPGALPRAPPG
ncbi:nucleolar and coiled-body phosphoprotein 1 [Rhipicephalus sanguineus]|uniref:nucleolar and coiled-body phosphoprotein 1 n=1 Tax=Rhipicephalus sanguineus TaxID=34632 RepID=UPI0018956EF3|nr:nucleolar and coiled-body phosphoprotein 1 [Rhipicephalus sanguineus]